MMPASSLFTTLAVITLPLYRLWNASGFVMLLGIIVAGWLAAFLDATVAYLRMRSPEITVVTPRVTLIGEPCRLDIASASPAGSLLAVTTVAGDAEGIRIGEGTSLIARFDRRGVHHHLAGEMTVIGPLGIASCRRRFHTAIPGGMHVGPTPTEAKRVLDAPSDEESPSQDAVSRGSDLTRSVRPYRRGDGQALVAWKASARSGELMVRELEGTVEREVVLAVHVPKVANAGVDQRSEEAIRRTAGYAIEALRQGRTVRLVTNHGEAVTFDARTAAKPARFGKPQPPPASRSSQIRTTPVRNETEVIARLAAVVAGDDLRGQPETTQAGAAVFLVGPNGDSWIGEHG